jgi:hypothetical protein
MQFKIVNTVTQKVIYDNLMSYEEAWTVYEQTQMCNSYIKFKIEEYKIPIKGLGRDPDLH